MAVRAGFLTAIVHRQTYRADIPKLARQLADLLRLDFDPNYKLLAARGIFVHCAYSGDAVLTDQVEYCTRSAFNAPAASAFNRAWYAVRLGFAERYAKDARNTAIPWFETARQIVRENGLSFVEAPIAIYWGWAEEVMGEAADIQRELQVLEAHFNPASRLEAAYRQMMIALLLTRRHDFNAAIARMRESLASMTESGHTLGRLAAYMGLVGIHLKCNEFDDALDALEQAGSLWFPCPIRDYAMELLGARISLAKNDVERATAQLRNAITLGERHGLENCLSENLFRQATATVCAFALRNGIGTGYVKRIVQVQRLSPPTSDVEQWPWPIRIYLFDRFSVLIDGVPLHFVGKAPKKPLELLKALISAGGFGIDAHRLSEQLWPDAEGPRDVFRVTYARLRKLLPYGEAVILDEGKLSLNADLVWTDLGTFERLAAACTNRLADADVQPEEIRALGRSLTRVYQGDLLRGETDAPWLISARDRAKSKFLRVLKELGRYWESRGDLSSAQELYTRALEIESVAEDIYRRLIRCYARSDQPAEALRTYRRCQQMLSQVLGIAPSAETAALAEHIRSGLLRQPQTTAHAS